MDDLKEQNDPTPPALERYAEAKALVQIAREQPDGIYLREGSFENSGAAILVCAGHPDDVKHLILFAQKLRSKRACIKQAAKTLGIIQQPEEQKTEMKITKIGYGIEMRDRYSGAAEQLYMEAEIDDSDRESINSCIDRLKYKTWDKLGSTPNPETLLKKVLSLEPQVAWCQDKIDKLQWHLNKLLGVWQGFEGAFEKIKGEQLARMERASHEGEPTEQQQH